MTTLTDTITEARSESRFLRWWVAANSLVVIFGIVAILAFAIQAFELGQDLAPAAVSDTSAATQGNK